MLTRALIVLLVVLNLGVALWWLARGDAEGDDAGMELPAGIARLQLADEALPGAHDAAASDADATAATEHAQAEPAAEPGTAPQGEPQADLAPVASATPAGARCLALGPFADAAAATAARAALPVGATTIGVREALPANTPWRVVMPALADREAATAMAGRLREAGFSDLFIVAEGAEANSIALGRFGGETAARSHAAALAQAGFDARAEAVTGNVRHWLDARAGDGVDAAALRRATGAAQANSIACPAGTGGAR
ncbi:SPOR domain-containing protein [Luteimonas aestuarii]|uniref:SPOR domain-containing protein n=1 Tax=Luteimonas aestuarii TaxID=453837 RepID=A0A4R5TTA0_9GAMM|nr:SPOR domain-containing protein [Luteimonas aestuarii]TDK24343.1 SPOR domain-containing protein [Luteimonas aestuarii]